MQTVSARELVENALDRIADPSGEGQRTFTLVFSDQVRLAADVIDKSRATGSQISPIAGLPISVKDLFDVASEVTTAGSHLLSNAPAATHDAAIVTRLRRAGALIVGRTTMTEFAYSGIGLNSDFGTPANPYRRQDRLIPGGSSSGAAVSVSDDMAVAAIGSDTGGSVRIPAALCGLTGFKPTQRRIPLDGTFPLSSSLDSIGVIARRVAGCHAVDAVIADYPLECSKPANLRESKFLVPRNYLLDGLDAHVARAFEHALGKISAAGAKLVELPLRQIEHIREINATGGLSGVEAYAVHRRLGLDMNKYFPLVLERILRGKEVSAADYLDMLNARAAIIGEIGEATAEFDAVLTPTVPIVAPPIHIVASSDDEYRRINGLLLRNTSVVNFLDGCSLSLPCHQPGEPPVGLMISGNRMQDAVILSLGVALENIHI